MNKIIFSIFIYTLSFAAKCEWTTIAISPNNDYMTFYNVDWSTLKISSNRRTIWLLFNRKGKNLGGIVSAKALYEFDCLDDKFRYLTATTFTESYGGGDVVEKMNNGEWEHVAPETSLKVVMEKICSRKIISKNN